MNILNLEHVSKRYVSRPILTDILQSRGQRTDHKEAESL